MSDILASTNRNNMERYTIRYHKQWERSNSVWKEKRVYFLQDDDLILEKNGSSTHVAIIIPLLKPLKNTEGTRY